MKRFVLIAVCFVLAVSGLTGCASQKKTALTIGQAQVSNEVFAYFYNEVCAREQLSDAALSDTAALTEAAVEKCCEYVGAVTLFGRFSLSLSAEEKDSIAVETEEEWKLYSDFYTQAGISKQTVNKINEAEKMRTALLLFYYGEGREYEVGEEEVEYYFNQTYVQFKAINGYLTAIDEMGETVALTPEQTDALRADFEAKRQKLASGASFEEINNGTPVEDTFVAVDNSAYPEGFLAQIATLEYDEPTLIEIGEYIFLVVRTDAKKGDADYYNSYRTSYIEGLRGESLTDMLSATAKEYTVTRNDREIKKAANAVAEARAEAEEG